MRILIVDDYPGAAQSTRTLLEILGHECYSALDGQTALAVLGSFDPDLVILDIGLPDLSGYEVAREIRLRARATRVFIAALTGWSAPEDRVRSLAAGIDLHVQKPPTRESLEMIVSEAAAADRSSRDA